MLYKKEDFKKNGFNEWLLLDLCLKNKIWNYLEVILTDVEMIPLRLHQIFKQAFLDACQDKESGDVTALMLSKIFRIKDHPLKNKGPNNNGFILAIENNNVRAVEAKASLDITSLTLFKNHPELCLQFNHQNKKKTPLNIAAENKDWDNVLRCVEEMMKVIPHELKSTFVKEVLPSLIKEAKTQNMTTARESLKKYRPQKYAVKIFDNQKVQARLNEIEHQQDIIFKL